MNRHALRKAAVLIGALDPRSADALLDQMPHEQAALVRQAVMELDRVDDAEQNTVIAEFLQPPSREQAAADDGVELALSSLARDTPTYQPPPSAPAGHTTTFPCLDQVDVHQLVDLLCDEQPQTIAVIASQLSPARASEMLLGLPSELQTEVAHRIATLGETDPDIVREIQQAVDARLSQQYSSGTQQSCGLAALRAILAATEADQRKDLLAQLAEHDPRLGRQLGYARQPTRDIARHERNESAGPGRAAVENTPTATDRVGVPRVARDTSSSAAPETAPAPSPDLNITFADLASLDDQALATIFHRSPPMSAIIALTGASQELVDRILQQLSSRQARQLQRQMCQLGPLRLRDIEHAQQQLAQLASELYRQGLIPFPFATRPLAAAA